MSDTSWDASTPAKLRESVYQQLREATSLPDAFLRYLATAYTRRFVLSGWFERQEQAERQGGVRGDG